MSKQVNTSGKASHCSRSKRQGTGQHKPKA